MGSREAFIVVIVIFVCFVLRRELFAANLLADGNDSVKREKPMTPKRTGSTIGVIFLIGCKTRSPGPK